MDSITGLHHVAAVATDVRSTLAFYGNAMGMTLLGRTVDPETPGTLRLYVGNTGLSNGALMSFDVEPGVDRGRTGIGHASAVSFAVPPGSLPAWRLHLSKVGVVLLGRTRSFREEHLCFVDPDGLELSIVESGDGEGRNRALKQVSRTAGTGILRIRSVEVQIDDLEPAARLLVDGLGLQFIGRDGVATGFLAGDVEGGTRLDLLSMPEPTSGVSGAGVVRRIAWRVDGIEALETIVARLSSQGVEVTSLRSDAFFRAACFSSLGGVGMALVPGASNFDLPSEANAPVPRLALPAWLESGRLEIERHLTMKYGDAGDPGA